MGKIKRKRNRIAENHNGTSSSESAVATSSELNSPRENLLQTILDQLQSANFEEKFCGLQSYGQLIDNLDDKNEVLHNIAIRTIAPLLLDKSSEIRNASAGVLRNYSVLSLEACETLIELDVLTPLIAFFHEYAENWAPDQPVNKDVQSETFIHCVSLLWNLCESNEIALKHVNESKVLDILIQCLDVNVFGINILIAVLQCLFVVVEDNSAAMNKIKENCDEKIFKIFLLEGSDPSTLLAKATAAGVILNIFSGKITNIPPETVARITSVLSSTLAIDHRLACNQLSSMIPLEESNSKPDLEKSKQTTVLERQFMAVSHLLEAQQISTEILANLCSCDELENENMDTDNLSDTEDSSEDNASNDGFGNNSGDGMMIDHKLSPEIIEAITSFELFHKVWARAALPAENVMGILSETEKGTKICKQLNHLRSRSLLCIHNMLSSLPLDAVGEFSQYYKIWVDTGKMAFQSNSGSDVELLESATAVMRAALDQIKSNGVNSTTTNSFFNELSLSDIEVMLEGIKECVVPQIRSNLIRMIGTLALILTTSTLEQAVQVIVAITEFILNQARKENELSVLAEAIDTIMDLYSEDETDLVAAKTDVVQKLNALKPILKLKIRQQKGSMGENSILIETVSTNLPRFIKYKNDRLCKLKI